MNVRSGPFEGPANFKPPALPEVDDWNYAPGWNVCQSLGRPANSRITHHGDPEPDSTVFYEGLNLTCVFLSDMINLLNIEEIP